VTITTDAGRRSAEIGGITVDLLELGEGRPLLYLHGAEGPDVPSDRHLHALARDFRVIAPWHPGFGRRERPREFRDVADLAYFYLDLADKLALRDAVLVGASFGGWIAAEMSVRNAAGFSHLVLSGPLGIKVRDREARDIADFFALTDDEFRAIAFADPAKGARDLGALDDDDLAGHFRSRESLAFYGWKPYMHNPQLRRWLHRIAVPTLIVAGAQDRFVFDGYHEAYGAGIPGATLVRLDRAGHFPHVEQPEEFTRHVAAHCRAPATSTASAA
jgi:pimeloyl-ACP methyl ester carboxylesterase